MKESSEKAQATRERIIQSAAELIHQQGYHNTGLNQILEKAGVTKGAFYFHFADKKALALAVIDAFTAMFPTLFGRTFADADRGALQKVKDFHEAVIAAFSSGLGKCGCPIGNLALELAALDTDLQARLNQSFEQLIDVFENVIQQGQQSGEISNRTPARALADFFVSSWEGAVLRMKAAQSFAPLELWYSTVTQLIKP